MENNLFGISVVSTDKEKVTQKRNDIIKNLKTGIVNKDLKTITVNNKVYDIVPSALRFENSKHNIYYEINGKTTILSSLPMRYTNITNKYYSLFKQNMKLKGKLVTIDKTLQFLPIYILHNFETTYIRF